MTKTRFWMMASSLRFVITTSAAALLSYGCPSLVLTPVWAQDAAPQNDEVEKLFMAVARDDISAIDKLLVQGLSVDTRSKYGNTALMMAAGYASSAPTLQFLLSKGANPNLKNKDGQTALDIARQLKIEAAVAALEPVTGRAPAPAAPAPRRAPQVKARPQAHGRPPIIAPAPVVPTKAPTAKPTAAKPAPPPVKLAVAKAAMPAPAVVSANKINGLFYMQKYWLITRHLESSTWYFAPDGQLYCDLTTGFSPKDLAAFKGTKGTYRVAGGKLTVQWETGQKSENDIEIVNGGWNWDMGLYAPINPFQSAEQVPGNYEGGTSMTFAGNSTIVSKGLELRADGTFTWDGIATFKTGEDTGGGGQSSNMGTWSLSGYTLRLVTTDGKVVSGIAFPFDDKATPIYPDRMFFAGTMYKRR